MFWEKEYREYIGFNHVKLVIAYLILTGLFFPFIFLGDQFVRSAEYPLIDIVIGLIYSAVITLGNTRIMLFHFRSVVKKNNPKTIKDSVIFFLKFHLPYTVFASTVMTAIGPAMLGEPLTFEYLAKNWIGSALFTTIYVGFYNSAYYLNALSVSLQQQEKLKRENVESQLEILKNQVKPHFLFNSLNTLSSLIPEEPNLAIKYVNKLSKVYRYILEIKEAKLISVHEELECIEAYVFMLKIRFGDKLIFELHKDDFSVDQHLVPLSLQLLVENAIKHNIISSKKPLTIRVFKGADNKMQVSNNLQPKLETMPSTGTGIANIKSRYEIIGQSEVEIIISDSNFTVLLPLINVT